MRDRVYFMFAKENNSTPIRRIVMHYVQSIPPGLYAYSFGPNEKHDNNVLMYLSTKMSNGF